MAERLNHSIPQHRGHLPNFLDSLQQEDNCLFAFIWLVHMQIMKICAQLMTTTPWTIFGVALDTTMS
uniref:Uncharacterized protein n=1 Tax=Meloidogyne enterolobii TaxID=390850 RepID=A0A6V7XCM0_MELEN|nr:unnamed protein product [Meloidogyne enterolobii]